MKIIFEDAVTIYGDKADKIEKILRRQYGYKNKQFNEKLKEFGSYEKYYHWLEKELENKQKQSDELDLEADIDLIDKPFPKKDIKQPTKQEKIKDEAIVDVLQYLQRIMKPDRVRAIAARFHVDPDIYMMAGLGNLPENYTDEDVWKTMDMSEDKPFYDHIWQPFYIDSFSKLQNLPDEIKDEINDIVERASNKREVEYPVDNESERYSTTFEAKILEDIILEDKTGIKIISAGTYLNFLN